MSKQYLTAHLAEEQRDIFGLAVSSGYVISAGGSSTVKLYDSVAAEHPEVHSFPNAHPLGVHHVAASSSGVAVTAGYGGETIVWDLKELKQTAKLDPKDKTEKGVKPGDVWNVALNPSGTTMVSTTYDGRVNVFDMRTPKEIVKEYITKGSFGLAVDISADGKFTASGHENGAIYVFNNETGKLLHSLPSLVKPVRAVSFSPGGKLLAAAGDSKAIALFDVKSGEQICNFQGHQGWIFSLAWNDTGEYLLSGAFDGKAKVWAIEQKACVATHSETEKALYTVKWLPRQGICEGFVTAGADQRINFYREATGS